MASIVSLFHTSVLVCFVLFWCSFLVWGLFAQSCSVMSDSLTPHGLQHARLLCPSISPGICSNSCQLSQWCYSIISSSVTLFPFNLSQNLSLCQWVSFLHQVAKRIGASASLSVLPKYFQGCFLLRVTGVISLLSKWLSRVFSNSTIKKH